MGKLRRVAFHGATIGMPLVRPLGGNLHELRVRGIRIYFSTTDDTLLVLTAGNKDTQALDIARARGRLR